MRFVPALVLLAALGPLAAQEAAEDDAALALTVAGSDQWTAAWQESCYARIWDEPGSAGWRADWHDWLNDIERSSGLAPTAAWRSFAGLSAGVASRPQRFHIQAELGALASPCFDLIRTSTPWTQPAAVDGADAAVHLLGQTLARFDETLVFADQAQRREAAPPPADTLLHLRSKETLADLIDHLGIVLPEALPASALVADYRLDLDATGLAEDGRSAARFAALRPIDRGQLDRLPNNAMISLAVGIDGEALYDLLAALPARDTEPLLDLARRLGLEGDAQALCADLDGTWAFAVAPNAIAPVACLSFPNRTSTEALVQRLCEAADRNAPEPGEQVTVQLPDAPLPLTVARDEEHFLITTSVVFAPQWLAGLDSGWSEGAAARRALDSLGEEAPLVLLAVDYPAVARTAIGLAGLARQTGGKIRIDASLLEHGTALLQTALPHLQAGYAWLRRDGDQGVIGQARTPHGIMPPLLSLGLLLTTREPARPQRQFHDEAAAPAMDEAVHAPR